MEKKKKHYCGIMLFSIEPQTWADSTNIQQRQTHDLYSPKTRISDSNSTRLKFGRYSPAGDRALSGASQGFALSAGHDTSFAPIVDNNHFSGAYNKYSSAENRATKEGMDRRFLDEPSTSGLTIEARLTKEDFSKQRF